MSKPNPGDEIAVDAGEPHKVWHRPPNAPWRMLDNAQADLSNPERFTIKRSGQTGTIYRHTDNWSIDVLDDGESMPTMRRGRVIT